MIQTTLKTQVVGIDIGYELANFAVVDVRGKIIDSDAISIHDHPDVNSFITQLCERIVLLVEANGGYESIRSVGVSAPSGNFVTGCIEYPPNLPWDGEIPMAAMMRDQLGLAVALANDAHAMALAETTFGSSHGVKDFIYVVIDKGFGSCIFSHGRAYLGNFGYAGEIGHTCVVENGRECGCGHRGCLESYCSVRGVIMTAQELLTESDEPSLMRNVEKLTPELITEFCEKGDKLAIEVYRRAGAMLGFALANYASVINPEAIILVGRIAKAGKWLLEPANDAFEEHVFHNISNRVKLIPSSIPENEREVLGASVLAWGVKEYSLFK